MPWASKVCAVTTIPKTSTEPSMAILLYLAPSRATRKAVVFFYHSPAWNRRFAWGKSWSDHRPSFCEGVSNASEVASSGSGQETSSFQCPCASLSLFLHSSLAKYHRNILSEFSFDKTKPSHCCSGCRYKPRPHTAHNRPSEARQSVSCIRRR